MWDFRATPNFSNNTDAFFVGKGKSSLPSPIDPAENINWLDVANVAGSIATEVYRVSTLGGQPPTSVSTPPSDVSPQLLNFPFRSARRDHLLTSPSSIHLNIGSLDQFRNKRFHSFEFFTSFMVFIRLGVNARRLISCCIYNVVVMQLLRVKVCTVTDYVPFVLCMASRTPLEPIFESESSIGRLPSSRGHLDRNTRFVGEENARYTDAVPSSTLVFWPA